MVWNIYYQALLQKMFKIPDLELHSMNSSFNPNMCLEAHIQSLISVLTTQTRSPWEREDLKTQSDISNLRERKGESSNLKPTALVRLKQRSRYSSCILDLGIKAQLNSSSLHARRNIRQKQSKRNSKVKKIDPVAHKFPFLFRFPLFYSCLSET